MWGIGKSSFGLILFRSLKSTYILLSFLGTATMLETYRGYLTTSNKPTSHCFLTSCLTLNSALDLILLNFYLTGLQPSLKGNIYTTISGSKPHNNVFKPFLSTIVINTPIFSSFLSSLVPIFINSRSSLVGFPACSKCPTCLTPYLSSLSYSSSSIIIIYSSSFDYLFSMQCVCAFIKDPFSDFLKAESV
jgi:hypothetical protein